jgi:hypothetical protein
MPYATSIICLHRRLSRGRIQGGRRYTEVHCWLMAPSIEKISAVTVRVRNMKASVQFYCSIGMCSAWSCSTAEKLRASPHCARGMQNRRFSIWRMGWQLLVGGGSSSMLQMWIRFGHTFAKRDFIRSGRETPPGANGVSTCSTRTDMSCRLRDRCGQHEHGEPQKATPRGRS